MHVQDLRPGATAFWVQLVGRMQISSGPSSVPVIPPSQDLWGIFLHLFFCCGESWTVEDGEIKEELQGFPMQAEAVVNKSLPQNWFAFFPSGNGTKALFYVDGFCSSPTQGRRILWPFENWHLRMHGTQCNDVACLHRRWHWTFPSGPKKKQKRSSFFQNSQ